MKAKKMMSIIATGIVAAGILTGCGNSTGNQIKTTAQTETQNETAEATSDATEAATETQKETENTAQTETESETEVTTASDTQADGKTLVVYYSATGTTAGVAQTIADATGGDLFEVVPVEPYTSDDLSWTDDNSRVSQEHNDESLRDVELVSTTVNDWDSYDTVFIGYPIWWGIAAWPMNGFVEANDFTGKTVIPFCTAASSGIGDSGDLLADLAGTGNWVEGRRLNRDVSDTDILEWTDELGIYNN